MGIVMVLGFFVGVILGSLSLALAERSLQRRSFMGRSCCPHCKKVLRWYDLFPILSYLLLRGKCRYCHKKIGHEYLLTEILLGILIAYLFYQYSFNFQLIPEFLFKIFFITVLVTLAITDLKKTLIPDRIIIPSLWIAFFFLLGITVFKIGLLYFTLNQTLLGKYLLPPNPYFQRHALIIVEPFFWSVILGILIAGFFYGLILITKGKGMGGGDVKLGGFLGLGLGFPLGLLAIFLGFFSGAAAAVGLLLFGKKKFGETLPFGPFLVAGALVALFWGKQIIDWYLKLGS